MAKQTRSGLARLTLADLRSELKRRERRAATLARRRDRLLRKAQALDTQIAWLNGSAVRNEQSLSAVLSRLLRGRVMSVKEAAAAALRSGYQTNSRNFNKVVNLMFIKSGKFRRVGVGRYIAK